MYGHGKQLLTDSDGERYYVCFNGEYSRPDHKRARNCKFNTKKDGSAANNQEVVLAKFAKLKEEVRRCKGGGQTPGSNHVIEGQVVPKWDDLVDEEISHYGNLV